MVLPGHLLGSRCAVPGRRGRQAPPRQAAPEAAIGDLPVIIEANHVTGTFDYLLRADLPDAAGLDRLLRELKRRTGVAATNTRVILRTTLPPALTARQPAP